VQDKTCNIVAQYVQALYATAHIRPYDNKSPLSNQISVELTAEALEQPGHHRVELSVSVEGTNGDGVLCFEAGSAIEAIVAHTNLTEEELAAMLEQQIPGLLLGNIRAALSTATMQTGYGPITLPPLSGEQLLALARKKTGE
jgi:preprotein translocase subunit SecB